MARPECRQASGKYAAEYVARFPETPTFQIAKMLLRDHGAAFNSLEHARKHVMYYRGVNGQHNRACARIPKQPPVKRELPPSDARPFAPYLLPKKNLTYLLIADWHVPYHDQAACELALDHAEDQGCNAVIMLGDMVDAHPLSRYQKDPTKRRFPDEVEMLGEILDIIRERLLPKVFIWKEGNHEARYNSYLFQKAPELFGLEDFKWENLYNLAKRKIEWVGNGLPVRCGRLSLLHGTEYTRALMAPVNPARGVFLRGHANAIVAHSHIPSAHNEPTFDDRLISCWSLGCGCDLHPDWCRLTRWIHGHGILTTDGSDWEFRNYKIVKGKVYAA